MRERAQRQVGLRIQAVGLDMMWGESARHLVLSFDADAEPCAVLCEDYGDTKADGVYVPPVRPMRNLNVRTGQRFGPRFNGFGSDKYAGTDRYDRFTLEAGTRVAGVANGLGLAVVHVDEGDIKEILRRYGAQMGKVTPHFMTTTTGRRLPYVAHEVVGGGVGVLHIDATGKWILITTGSD